MTDSHMGLETARLRFGVWSEADAALAAALWGDPRVTRLIGGPFTPGQVAARLAREIATHASHGVQYWPLFLRDSGEHVGCCGLKPYPHEPGAMEMGFQLRAGQW